MFKYPFMEWTDGVPGATLEQKVVRGIEEFKRRYQGQMPDLGLVPELELAVETTIEGITVRPSRQVSSGNILLKITDPDEVQPNGFL